MDDQARIERIIAELSLPGALDESEQRIGAVAPQLQRLLDDALGSGGWFDEAYESQILKTATTPDEQARVDAVRVLVTEQTRLGMLVGVAVGWAIAERLRQPSGPETQTPGQDDRAI